MLNTIEERDAIMRDNYENAPQTVAANVAFHNILMPTDFSKCSDQALRYAIAIARRYGATLHLFHWVDRTAYQFVCPDAVQAARDASWRDIQQLDTDLVVKGLLRNVHDKLLVADGELFPRFCHE